MGNNQSQYYENQRITEASEREHQCRMAEQEQARLLARREHEDNMRREEAESQQAKRDHEYRMAEQEQASLLARRDHEDNLQRQEAESQRERQDHEYRMQQSAKASQQAAYAQQRALAVSVVQLVLIRRNIVKSDVQLLRDGHITGFVALLHIPGSLHE